MDLSFIQEILQSQSLLEPMYPQGVFNNGRFITRSSYTVDIRAQESGEDFDGPSTLQPLQQPKRQHMNLRTSMELCLD